MKRLMLALAFLPCLGVAGEVSPKTKQEITHLLAYLKDSGCQFNRNGSWYSSTEAVSHLNEKYQYLLKKDLVSSAEDFINRAASESSMSSKPYQVKCGGNAPVKSGPWLMQELNQYRSGKK